MKIYPLGNPVGCAQTLKRSRQLTPPFPTNPTTCQTLEKSLFPVGCLLCDLVTFLSFCSRRRRPYYRTNHECFHRNVLASQLQPWLQPATFTIPCCSLHKNQSQHEKELMQRSWFVFQREGIGWSGVLIPICSTWQFQRFTSMLLLKLFFCRFCELFMKKVGCFDKITNAGTEKGCHTHWATAKQLNKGVPAPMSTS